LYHCNARSNHRTFTCCTILHSYKNHDRFGRLHSFAKPILLCRLAPDGRSWPVGLLLRDQRGRSCALMEVGYPASPHRNGSQRVSLAPSKFSESPSRLVSYVVCERLHISVTFHDLDSMWRFGSAVFHYDQGYRTSVDAVACRLQ
jgi:hypothetical protein